MSKKTQTVQETGMLPDYNKRIQRHQINVGSLRESEYGSSSINRQHCVPSHSLLYWASPSTIMTNKHDLIFPLARPTDATLSAFWSVLVQISSRTRNTSGRWVGSPEVKRWNAANKQVCHYTHTKKYLTGSQGMQSLYGES
jgi:hypothetical protein